MRVFYTRLIDSETGFDGLNLVYARCRRCWGVHEVRNTPL
jgi:hypothetical protein